MKESEIFEFFKKLEKEGWELRKVNLPSNKENYLSGNGEGLWCYLSKEDIVKYDNDEKVGDFEAYICNDPEYYNEVNFGDKLVAEFRGKNRPVFKFSQVENFKCLWN